MNVLLIADYPAAELISDIVSVQSEVELLHALNASFTEDIGISRSTIANNELQELYDQMHIDSSGSPDHDECQEEFANEFVHELIAKIKQYSEDSTEIAADDLVREGLHAVLSRISQLQSTSVTHVVVRIKISQ